MVANQLGNLLLNEDLFSVEGMIRRSTWCFAALLVSGVMLAEITAADSDCGGSYLWDVISECRAPLSQMVSFILHTTTGNYSDACR